MTLDAAATKRLCSESGRILRPALTEKHWIEYQEAAAKLPKVRQDSDRLQHVEGLIHAGYFISLVVASMVRRKRMENKSQNRGCYQRGLALEGKCDHLYA